MYPNLIFMCLSFLLLILLDIGSSVVHLHISEESVTLQNAYLKVQFDLLTPRLGVLHADHTGNGDFENKPNLFAGGQAGRPDARDLNRAGVVLEILETDTDPTWSSTHACSLMQLPGLRVDTLTETTDHVKVAIQGVGITGTQFQSTPNLDKISDPDMTSTWTLSLSSGNRHFQLSVEADVLRPLYKVVAIRLSFYLQPGSLYSLFSGDYNGVAHIMHSPLVYFTTDRVLHKFYASDHQGTVGIIPGEELQTTLADIVLTSSNGDFFSSGLQLGMVSAFPITDSFVDYLAWTYSPPNLPTLQAGSKYIVTVSVSGNDLPFPADLLSQNVKCCGYGDFKNDSILSLLPSPFKETSWPEMSIADSSAFFTAVYGSAVGAYGNSYTFPGMVHPTLAHPNRNSYHGDYNFFDPDQWETVSAFSYSGDPYLLEQAKLIIDTAGTEISSTGQIPHHFHCDDIAQSCIPIYSAISSANQTGPNIFWIMSALQYASCAADYEWLAGTMPIIEKAVDFLTDLYDPDIQLILAPGPLWVDTLIRGNYSSDTNAFMVHLLRSIAEAENFLGGSEYSSLSLAHRTMADEISDSMNQRLWNDDHYITQLNPDGSTQDFVDYDANLLAIGFGIAQGERKLDILARIDKGKCTHVFPTYISEKMYTAEHCYLHNTGDSRVSLGRVAWADAWARVAMEDATALNNFILEPLLQALDTHVWMFERYTCAGKPAHNSYFHEYPEVLAMLLRETRYGIRLGFGTVTVRPTMETGETDISWQYRVGDVIVRYSRQIICLQTPVWGDKVDFFIHGLDPSQMYRIEVNHAWSNSTVNSDGILQFNTMIKKEQHEICAYAISV